MSTQNICFNGKIRHPWIITNYSHLMIILGYFQVLHKNIYCGYSLEVSRQDKILLSDKSSSHNDHFLFVAWILCGWRTKHLTKVHECTLSLILLFIHSKSSILWKTSVLLTWLTANQGHQLSWNDFVALKILLLVFWRTCKSQRK